MSDEVVPETAASSVESGQSGERPRKPRKRGKRNRSKSSDAAQQTSAGAAVSPTESRSHAAPPPRERERGGRRGSTDRSKAHGYRDGLDRFFCISGRRQYPVEWPVSHRQGLAIARLHDVARRDQEVLICDKLHEGACVWPDGDPAIEPVLTATAVPHAAGPLTRSDEPESAQDVDA